MRPLLLSVAALLPFAGQAEAQPTASGARAFLEALYAPYEGRTAQPVTLARPAEYYEAKLARAIIAEAAAANQRGEAPELNGDPICDCQDYLPFKAAIAPIRLKGNRAETVVTFDNSRPKRLEIELVATKAGWRIYDIRTSDYRLRGLLKL
jgi:Protein of unknown function (DUF3828)